MMGRKELIKMLAKVDDNKVDLVNKGINFMFIVDDSISEEMICSAAGSYEDGIGMAMCILGDLYAHARKVKGIAVKDFATGIAEMFVECFEDISEES